VTESSLPPLFILAPSPGALVELGGISLLERLRRIALKFGYREAIILSNSVDSIAPHIANPSWHGTDVSLKLHEWTGAQVTTGDILDCLGTETRALLLFADFYYDGRLVRALSESQVDAVLVDSDPWPSHRPLWKDSEVRSFGRGPAGALLSHQWFSAKSHDDELLVELLADAMAGLFAFIDAAAQESYLPSMRRRVRPLVFPAPAPEHCPLAERLLRDATQKGVLDLPALVHSPIEKWIVSHLCRTSITPNQVTLGTGLIGLTVTLLYASGHLGLGAMLALAVGVLDGVDGKLARLKVQTTKIGKGEHALDYCLEMSWWGALAYYFHVSGQVPYAYLAWGIFFVSDVLDRLAKWSVERRLGRTLDDVSRFDRLVRYVSGRRNIYTWLFAFCLLLGAPAKGFVLLCAWGVTSTAIHLFRALQVRFSANIAVAHP
jgi:phosphatidylglycerophosphate synthase